MNYRIAQLICQSNPDLEIREDYSGRAMFGSTTTGIICDNISGVISTILLDPSISQTVEEEGLHVDMKFSIDNMGIQTIVY